MKEERFAGLAFNNPVRLARPKAPRLSQNENAKAWSDDQARAMVSLLRSKAEDGGLVAKRDYALLLFCLMSGRSNFVKVGVVDAQAIHKRISETEKRLT